MTRVRAASRVRASRIDSAKAARSRADPGGFAVADHAATEAVAASAAPASSALLMLQDEAAPLRRDRDAARGGRHALIALQAMQAGLLDGDPRRGLAALEAALRSMPDAADAGLQAVIGAIRQRASIEAARFEAAAAASRRLRGALGADPGAEQGDDASVTT